MAPSPLISQIADRTTAFIHNTGISQSRFIRPGAGSNGDNTALTTTAKAHQLAKFTVDGA